MRAAMLASVKQRPQFARHPLRLAFEPPPGDPDDPIAREEQRGVAGAVALEGGARLAVKLVAVELDDEPMLGPERVDGELADGDVDRGQRDAVPAAGGKNPTLERRAGVGERRPAGVEHGPEHLEAVAAVGAPARDLERDEVEQPQPLGLVKRALSLAPSDHLGEVEQRPGDGCHRNALVDGAVVGWRERTRWTSMPGTGMNRARNDDVDPHARD